MKHLISILSGSLFACVSFVYAEESASENTNIEQQVSEAQVSTEGEISQELSTPDATNNVELPVQTTPETQNAVDVNNSTATEQPVASVPTTQVKTPEKISIWDKILNMFKVSEPKAKTCEEAFNKMEGISVNFSNTSDFAENGDKYMDLYYQKIKQTNSFGTRSANLYIDISNLNVNSDVLLNFIGKWSKIFSEDKKTVLWNLSDNKSLEDNVIDSIDLSNMYSLNLSNTSITDLTVNKIISILNIQNTGKLVCVNLSGTKVSAAAVESLKAAFQKAKTDFESKNPGKTYDLEGDNNSGVIFNKLPGFLKQSTKIPVSKTESITAPVSAEETSVETQLPAVESPVAETTAITETPISENNEETTSVTETTDTSSSAISEASANTTTNQEINDVLNEADKLIENAEQAVNNEQNAEAGIETTKDSRVTNEVSPIEENIATETSSETESENA